VSTTQVLTGAILAIGLFEGAKGVNWKMFIRIFAGWVPPLFDCSDWRVETPRLRMYRGSLHLVGGSGTMLSSIRWPTCSLLMLDCTSAVFHGNDCMGLAVLDDFEGRAFAQHAKANTQIQKRKNQSKGPGTYIPQIHSRVLWADQEYGQSIPLGFAWWCLDFLLCMLLWCGGSRAIKSI
jgi:hypothetical protein